MKFFTFLFVAAAGGFFILTANLVRVQQRLDGYEVSVDPVRLQLSRDPKSFYRVALVRDGVSSNDPTSGKPTSELIKKVRSEDLTGFYSTLNANPGPSRGEINDALFAAAEYGRIDMLKLLLKAGGDPNATSGFGERIISAAARAGRKGIVQVLLDNGADPMAIDSSGKTALAQLMLQRVEIAKILEDATKEKAPVVVEQGAITH